MTERRFFKLLEGWVEVIDPHECVGHEAFSCSMLVGEGSAEPSPLVATISVSTVPPPRLESSEGFRVAHGDGWVFAFATAAKAGFAWFERGRPLPAWQYAAPLRLIVAWILDASGGALVHAAAVHRANSGALLIAGPSGAGKSTLSVAAEKFGFRFLGDDWVPIHGSMIGPLYRTAKLSDSSPALDGHRASIVGPAGVLPHPGKRIVFMRQQGWTTALCAVVTPEVHDGGDVRIERIRLAEAIRRIAPSTVLQAPQTENTLGVLSHTLRALPCYRMRIGQDLVMAMEILEGLCA